LKNDAFLNNVSNKTQSGEITRINIKINPNGFQNNALQISPFSNDKTDLVEPHEGHGKLVIRLNKHTPGSISPEPSR
jgi:hypothetical protein